MIAAKFGSVLSHSDLDKGTEDGGVCGCKKVSKV